MDTQLIVRIIVSAITLINAMAASFGFDPLNIDEGTVYTVVSFVAAVAAWVWGFWKNNNFTEAAKTAQQLLDTTKAEQKSSDEA